MKVEISPSDKSLVTLASRIYDEQQLSELVEFNGTITELDDIYPIECLRKNGNIYRVSYLGDGSIVVLLFDASGNKVLGNIHSIQRLKSDFDELVKGQSLEQVRAIDPDGEYFFLYTGRNDTPKFSSHYTQDGYLITIKYNETNTIVSVSEELI